MRSTLFAAALGVGLATGCGSAPSQTAMPEPEATSAATKNADGETYEAKEEKKEGAQLKPDVKAILEQFSSTSIGVEEADIAPTLRPVIKKLVEASKIMHDLFLIQVDPQNPQWRVEIEKSGDPYLLGLFDVMAGPWNRLEHNKPFWGGVEKPAGASFYPRDLNKEQLEAWIAAHPEQKEALSGYFTVIGREGESLKAVPYSQAYQTYLEPAAKLLEEAAGLSKDKRLKKYLKARAAAFRSNEYRQSDMDWMELGDGALEVVIGPYEVYEDALMGYKAAFEAFITLRDPVESKKLDKIKKLVPQMEQALPIDKKYRNVRRGSDSPLSVVEVLHTSGDTRSGIQTIAFNLPNDEVVREKKGSKKVMLKNVAQAKFNKILLPIAGQMMRQDQVEKVTFEAFFNHTLVHETAHGLGPGRIKMERGGKTIDTTVNDELKELYSTIEEAKADALGMYLNYFLVEKKVFSAEFIENVYASFLGGFFRSVRFGAGEAHGIANIIQFNYLMEKGAILDENGKYSYVSEKMKPAVESLSRELLMLEALGDYTGSKAFIDKYGKMPATLADRLAALKGVPTDIRPQYPIEQQMAAW
ncbi:MAG: peptidase [Myxococcota bacterium]|nr:peptidase [Myxococcota bacterium]